MSWHPVIIPIVLSILCYFFPESIELSSVSVSYEVAVTDIAPSKDDILTFDQISHHFRSLNLDTVNEKDKELLLDLYKEVQKAEPSGKKGDRINIGLKALVLESVHARNPK